MYNLRCHVAVKTAYGKYSPVKIILQEFRQNDVPVRDNYLGGCSGNSSLISVSTDRIQTDLNVTCLASHLRIHKQVVNCVAARTNLFILSNYLMFISFLESFNLIFGFTGTTFCFDIQKPTACCIFILRKMCNYHLRLDYFNLKLF
jgi:hypothetical protein